jgi:type I restriction enzyme S subunit
VNAPVKNKGSLVRLGEVARFIRGITYKPRDVSSAADADAIACMRTKNIQTDLEDDDLVYIPKIIASEEKLLVPGDILVSSANSWNLVGKCCWTPALSYTATFGGFTSVLRPNHTNIFPRYLYHWFSTEKIQRLARSFGQQTTNISNLNHSRCLELQIPLPPLDEQRRIAAILDKADALRRKRKRAIELLDETIASLVKHDLDASTSIYLGELITDGPTNGLYKPSSAYNDGGHPILRINNFYRGKIVNIETLKRLTISREELARYRLNENDIIINRVNSLEYLGKSAIVPRLREATVFESNMMRFEIDHSTMLPEVCIALLQINDIKRQILSKAKNAVNQSSINQKDVMALRLPLPRMEAQRRFVTRTKAIVEITHQMLVQSSMVDLLFSSLQHRAFSGQL